MIHSVLIANRGEIARRIIRTLKDMSILANVVYDEREQDTLYVREADQAFSLGTGKLEDTFLNIPKIINAAKELGCDAIHPGYGFLSENPEFAAACEKEGINFIGPDAEVIRLMGMKTEAFRMAGSLGIPLIPGIYGSKDKIIRSVDKEFFPCLIKAAAGGGGKAMRILERNDDLEAELDNASREAHKYFGNGRVYLEKYLEEPRHIEVQILADAQGHVIHLFERECSLQRRYQKVIEEAPAESIGTELKKNLYDDSVKIAQKVGYKGAGTIEFLVDSSGKHYFLEMNTRIQVEHPVTELITGVDIVAEQIRIAEGKALSEDLGKIRINGHAIEARLYAEDPADQFKPSPGILTGLHFPDDAYLRIDSGVEQGDTLMMEFDPMLAKISASGSDRSEAISNLRDALEGTSVQGVVSNRLFLLKTLDSAAFKENKISTHFISQHMEDLLQILPAEIPDEWVSLAGLYISMQHRDQDVNEYSPLSSMLGFWRIRPGLDVYLNNKTFSLFSISLGNEYISAIHEEKSLSLAIDAMDEGRLIVRKDGQRFILHYSLSAEGDCFYLSNARRNYEFRRGDWLSGKRPQISGEVSEGMNGETQIKAPLSGLIVKINFNQKDWVAEGEGVLVVESMKMENEIRVPARARIMNLFVTAGQTVSEGDLLFELEYEK